MKKVLLIVIDALASRVCEPALEAGRLPHMAELIAAGTLRRECTAIFPSITPAATCSLITGCYPFEHGISGNYWYDPVRDEIAYYGTDIWAILNEGIDDYLLDFQRKLNEERLQMETIFERIEKHGKLKDAVINFLWYRGTVEHEISLPLAFRLLPANGSQALLGPHLMFLGDFVNSPLDRGEQLSPRGGLLRRYGFHDETTADYLLQIAEKQGLPDFTVAYFPNNDFDSHKEGPLNACTNLEAIDAQLGKLFDLFGGLSNMLENHAIVITGDHSQSDLHSADDAAVNLDDLLAEFQVAEAGCKWQPGDDLMACPNMRAAQIYLHQETEEFRDQVVDSLLRCDAIDQVIWCDTGNGLHECETTQFHVKTHERRLLSFCAAEDGIMMGEDNYGGRWRWSGDLAAIDAKVDADQRIRWGDYPNAFERISTAFFRQSGSLWITAKLGKEFCLPNTQCDSSGSHGSLHALDSTSPLIVAGMPEEIALPEVPRSVDIVPLCLELLGLEPERQIGESHTTACLSHTVQ